MGVLKVLLMLVEIVSGVLLIGVILLQKSKDEGLGLAFGAGVGESLFGSRAGNVLTKITITLAVIFMANTLLIGYLLSGSSASGSLTDDLPAQPVVPTQQAPVGGVTMPASPVPVPAPTPLSMEQPVSAPPVAPSPAPAVNPVPAQ